MRFEHGRADGEGDECSRDLANGKFGPQLARLKKGALMLMTVFAILLVLWLLGFTVLKVASGIIHLLLILAVISLVMHFVRGRASRS